MRPVQWAAAHSESLLSQAKPCNRHARNVAGVAQPQHRYIGQLALKNTTAKAGATGRQGVSGVVATVFGSTGFLGRYVVSAIGERGGRVVCPHRCDDMDMQHLRPMGDLGNIITLQDFSIRDDELIQRTIAKSNVVINLIGQNYETWNYNFNEVRSVVRTAVRAMLACHNFSQAMAAFSQRIHGLKVCKRLACRSKHRNKHRALLQALVPAPSALQMGSTGALQVHVNFPTKLARMAAATPAVERFIQVSCLGADADSSSPRLATKAAGDEAVQREFPGATLLRCGPLVGVEDRFYNDLALWRYSGSGVPVVDGGHSRVQPVYVCDVAAALYNTLQYNEAKGATYELGGPSVMQCAFATNSIGW